MNTREGERVATDLAVTVHGPERGPFQARLRNASMSGAGIEFSASVGIDSMEPVELMISLPVGKRLQAVRITGFVVRRDEGWLGVMFMDEAPWLPSRLREAAVQPTTAGSPQMPVSRPPMPTGSLVSADS